MRLSGLDLGLDDGLEIVCYTAVLVPSRNGPPPPLLPLSLWGGASRDVYLQMSKYVKERGGFGPRGVRPSAIASTLTTDSPRVI